MLTRVRIRGFKAIYDSGQITLGPLNLLIGKNGSGKSSVIEALQWLQSAAVEGLESATVDRFGSFENLCNRRTDAIQLSLSVRTPAGRPLTYQLRVKEGRGGRPIVAQETSILGRTRGAIPIIRSKKGARGPAVRSISGGTRLVEGDALGLQFIGRRSEAARSVIEYLRKAVFLRLSPTAMAEPGPTKMRGRGAILDEEGAQLPALLHSMKKTEITLLLNHLHKVLGKEYVGVGVRTVGDRGTVIVLEHMRSRGGRRTYELPAKVLSEGTRRLVAIYALLSLATRPSLIAIEEVENGLDPWTLRHVLAALREATTRGTQVVLTTHSPFLLDNVSSDEITYVSRHHGDSTYVGIRHRADVLRFEGEVPPGAMYVADFFERRGKKR